MPQVNVPTWDVTNFKTGYAALAIAACIGVVADATVDRGVKTPANGANTTIVNFKGVSMKPVAAGEYGSFARTPGDRVVMKANGAITRGATVFLTSADAAKEGFVKSYTSVGVDGVAFIIGQAETTAADGEFIEVTLGGLYLKTA